MTTDKSSKASVKRRGSSKHRTGAGRPSSRSASKRKTRRRSADLDKELPVWAQILLTVCGSIAILVSAYFVMIRPYSYRWKPCYGSKEYEVCMPSGFQVYGIDVSHHQGEVNWNRIAASSSREFPILFAMIKATEGGDFLDENYAANFAAARMSGLACGAYLFYNPDSPPDAQAAFYINNVSLGKGCLPPVIDIENNGESRNRLQTDLLECLDILEKHYGVKPIIYASYKFWKHYLNNPSFRKYHLWIAHYRTDRPESDTGWSIWQFSDRGRMDGIRGYVDLNVFNGDVSDFRSLLMK